MVNKEGEYQEKKAQSRKHSVNCSVCRNDDAMRKDISVRGLQLPIEGPGKKSKWE